MRLFGSPETGASMVQRKKPRNPEPEPGLAPGESNLLPSARRITRALLATFLLLTVGSLPLCAREKDAIQYGAGLIINVPMSESDVVKAVEEVAGNGIIRGTKEYNKDEYITGAVVATSSPLFPAWTEGGKIFYKVRLHALDPRNFKQSGDVGTLAVRYVVMGQSEKNTVLRIDAVFVEEFRHTSHPSNGSVESSEYKDIHDHLEAMEVLKQQTSEAEKERQEQLARKQRAAFESDTPPVTTPPPIPAAAENVAEAMTAPTQSLQERVHDLRRQVERIVKSPGAALKSAPFRSASTLQSLATGTEVLIVISTPYWYGVETHDGQHGWLSRDQLELLP
jgi:polyhydroxyalkanoate synthesis regulator phasin